ncbi:MAG: class I SAM-dependent methyltransferase [Bacillota bacterium]
MQYTGERFIPDCQDIPEINARCHIERYLFAKNYVKGAFVLDAACGTGYGANILKKQGGAGKVIGIDICPETIAWCKSRYPDLTFLVQDVRSLDFPAKFFDIVVSFETIEHVADGARWLEESWRVLKKGGLLIVSSPNRDVTAPGKKISHRPANKFHHFEYNQAEFCEALSRCYEITGLYGQWFVSLKSLRNQQILQKLGPVQYLVKPLLLKFKLKFKPPARQDGTKGAPACPVQKLNNHSAPRYLIAVCRKKEE